MCFPIRHCLSVVGLLLATGVAVIAAEQGEVDARRGITEIKKIETILTTQAKAWNAADIPSFMEYYWKSEKLTFSSGGTTRRGWQATMDSYKKRYPTPQKMGQLTFSDVEIEMLGDHAALVLGKWRLKRKQDEDLGGNFSLVFKMIDGQWLIIHDHSSALKTE